MARYRILPEHSRVWIEAKSNVHPIRSSTAGLEGFVELDLDQTGRVDPASPPAGHLSLEVRRLQSGNALEDREMQRRIEARKFPTIEGTMRSMEAAGSDGSYAVSGDVTFRGVARPHAGTMTVEPVDDTTIALSGQSRFDIRDYGMEPPRVLVLRVQPEVEVRVEIIARKES